MHQCAHEDGGMSVGVSVIHEKMSMRTWLSKINLLKYGVNKHHLPRPQAPMLLSPQGAQMPTRLTASQGRIAGGAAGP